MGRQTLDRLGARYDGVEVLHVEPAPPPGSNEEKRAIRQVGLVFGLAGLFGFAFVVMYVGSGWFLPDWRFNSESAGDTWGAIYTPVLGACMGLSLGLVGLGLVLFSKKLLPHETAVQDKHDGSTFDRATTAATLVSGLENSGLARRKLITRTLGFMGAGVGIMLLSPLGGLIKNPSKGNPLGTTSFKAGVRLVRDDGTPIRPGDQVPGSLQTVFPAVPGGNRQADAATMLIRLRPEQVANNQPRQGQAGFAYGDYVAYSKICTHAGCPVSLYEQETSRILCPCHQSQFDVTQGAKPVFGPATRSLPQLPLDVDAEGFFIAKSDYIEAVGPTYWNRERI
jgi:ubiquinol-cytochrome c reductase iron-sulfur subunit